jgi:hypothetical protein
MSIISKTFNDRVIRIRKEDRYVSATDMAQACGKLFGHWNTLKATTEYLQVLEPVIGIPITEIIEINKGGIPENQGTWLHPKVALRFAQWCSAEFAVQVDCWIDELLLNGTVSVKPLSPGEAMRMYADALIALEQEAAVTKAIAIEANSTAKLADSKADQALLATAENSLEVAKNTQALEGLKLAMVSLENTVSKFSSADSLQSKRNLLNEFIQHFGGILAIKHGISIADGIRKAWSSLSLKLRNSVYRFDLNSRVANEERVYKQQLEQWEKNGKPRGQKPTKKTRPDLLEDDQKLEAALECCTVLATEVIN